MKAIRKYDIWEISYLIIFGIILARDSFCTTMFEVHWMTVFSLPLYLIAAGYAAAKLLLQRDKYTKTEWFFSGIFIGVFCIAAVVSGYHYLVTLAFLVVGAKDIKVENILKVYVGVTFVVLFLAFVACKLSIIEDVVYDTGKGMRHSYGIIYPTDYSAHIVFLILAICMLLHQKKEIYFSLISAIVAGLIFWKCRTYTAVVCLCMMTVMFFFAYIARKTNFKIPTKVKQTIGILPVILSGVYYVLCLNYNEESMMMTKIDTILSGRLMYGQMAIDQYGFSLFGKFVEEVGFGGSNEWRPFYFFIDNSYLRTYIEHGILVFILVLIMLYVIAKKCSDNNKTIFWICFIIVVLHSFMEQHLLEIAFNPMLLMFFAKMEEQKDVP